MHDAARTIILQSHAATAVPASGMSFQAWLVTMLVPMWLGVRILTRSWAAAMDLGSRHRKSAAPANGS